MEAPQANKRGVAGRGPAQRLLIPARLDDALTPTPLYGLRRHFPLRVLLLNAPGARHNNLDRNCDAHTWLQHAVLAYMSSKGACDIEQGSNAVQREMNMLE